MDTQRVATKYRLTQWAQVIQARLESGQNINEFCETAGISRNAYFYWQKKLREKACTELAKTEEPKSIVPGGWMQLATKETRQETLNIEINGCHVAVNAKTDSELLKKICRTLMSL